MSNKKQPRQIFGDVIAPTCALSLLAFFLYSLDISALPDFDSYSVIYYDGEELGYKYAVFYLIGLIFQGLGLDYQQFRFVILAAGLTIYPIFLEIRENSNSVNGFDIGSVQKNRIFLLLLISVFIFEFYVIRLRAGASMFFFVLAFYTWENLTRTNHKKFRGLVIFLAFLSVSASLHLETFIVTGLFIFPPIISCIYTSLSGILGRYIYFFLSLGMWSFLFLVGISEFFEDRGPDLASQLNPVRFLMIAIVPILMWPIYLKFISISKARLNKKIYFSYFYSSNYIASAMALFIFYYASPAANDAGEAIVRVMELSSLGAIMALVLGGISFQNIIAIYILVINSLFFLNTVYG